LLYNNRFYIKDVPVGLDLPLIICLHGGGGSGSSLKAQLDISLDAVVVYPNAGKYGNSTAWNAGPLFNNSVDDLSWLEGLIGQVKIDESIDDSKIYIIGYSNGGMMAHRYGSVKGGIGKMFIFNSALIMTEEYNYTGELSVWKSTNDNNIPPIGNKTYHSFVYEYRQMGPKINSRSEFRVVAGAEHSVNSFKDGLVRVGTSIQAEIQRFFEL